MDRTATALRLKKLGAPIDRICEVLGMTRKTYDKLMAKRVMRNSKGKPTPIPAGAAHLVDSCEQLTEDQEARLKKVGGMAPRRNAKMLLEQIKCKAVDRQDVETRRLLLELSDAIVKFYGDSK